MTRYLVTSALPYANGPIHFGHVVGAFLPADIYVRTQRMLGEEVLYVCGGDEHGVAITIGAERDGVPYAEYVQRWRNEIKGTLDQVGIEFDIWSGTSTSPHHAELSQEFFRRLNDGGYLKKRESEQLFDAQAGKFLADRYIEGVCYVCGFEQARGDECPSCGTWIEALKLGSPISKISGTVPELRKTSHWYLDMPRLRDEFIGKWIEEHDWKSNVDTFVRNMLKDVPERPITRDLEWGIPVPADLSEGESGKVLFVWFDAPIGYVSFTKEWAEKRGEPEAWRDWWQSEDTRLLHFIGKDNIPFHCMLFPAILWGVQQNYILPWAVPANEFYNLQGRKFSTSENWTIDLDDFFKRYDREAARFYLIASMPETSDSEWRWEGLRDCVNASLADTIGNLVTRVLRFAAKHFEGKIPPMAEHLRPELDQLMLEECGEICDPSEAILEYKFRKAASGLLKNAAVANVFIDRTEPWALRKTDMERCAAVLHTCSEWLSWLARWMVPFMPGKAQKIWGMLGQAGAVADQAWPGKPSYANWRSLSAGTPLGEVEGLFAKIDEKAMQAEIQALHDSAAK